MYYLDIRVTGIGGNGEWMEYGKYERESERYDVIRGLCVGQWYRVRDIGTGWEDSVRECCR